MNIRQLLCLHRRWTEIDRYWSLSGQVIRLYCPSCGKIKALVVPIAQRTPPQR